MDISPWDSVALVDVHTDGKGKKSEAVVAMVKERVFVYSEVIK